MIQPASNSSENNVLWLHSAGSLEHLHLAQAYWEDLQRQHAPPAREILDRTRSVLAKTLQQYHRMDEMIRHFRSIEKPPAGKKSSHAPEEGSVYDSVYQVLRAMQYEFPLERITVLKILPHDLLPLPIPREHLEMILFHLIYNARQSVGEAAGIVTIEAADKFSLSPENRYPGKFVLRVSDTGPGIPEQYLPRIFDPFFAVENLPRLHGIGLCLIKQLVHLHQADLRIESSLMGTSFYLEFSRNR